MLRVRTVFTGIQGTPYYSNLYFGGTTEGEAVFAAQAVHDWWEANVAAIATPLQAVVEGEVAHINATTGDIIEMFSVGDDPVVFTGSGEAAPVVAQALAQFRTNTYINGRELRGRMYIPYLLITFIDDGKVAAAAIATLEGRLADLLADAAPGGGLVVWSRTHGQAAAVSSATVWDEFAVMRSRRD